MKSAQWFRIGAMIFGMLTASYGLAAPSFCEFSSLPPNELLERMAESYGGILEFGGELFSSERLALLEGEEASLELFFEPVEVSDQRSVSLNDSLGQLGDWALLNSDEYGLTHEAIRSRLRESVRTYLSQQERQRTQSRSVQQERAEVQASLLWFAPYGRIEVPRSPRFLDGDRLVVTSAVRSMPVRIWDRRSNLVHELAPPGDWARESIPLAQARPGSDELLIVYAHTRHIELRNWRTGQIVRDLSILQHAADFHALISSTGQFAVVQTESENYVVVDIETTQRHLLDGKPHRLNRISWCADGRHFVRSLHNDDVKEWDDDGKLYRLELYRMDRGPDGSSAMVKVASAEVPDGSPQQVIVGQDHRHLILNDRGNDIGQAHRIQGYRWGADGASLEQVWSHRSPWPNVHFAQLQSWIRTAASGRPEVVFVSHGGLQILDAADGTLLFSNQMPLVQSVYEAKMSNSGRHLLLKDSAANELAVWDLELRREVARVEKFGDLRDVAVSDDGSLLLMSDAGRLVLLRPGERGFE